MDGLRKGFSGKLRPSHGQNIVACIIPFLKFGLSVVAICLGSFSRTSREALRWKSKALLNAQL